MSTINNKKSTTMSTNKTNNNKHMTNNNSNKKRKKQQQQYEDSDNDDNTITFRDVSDLQRMNELNSSDVSDSDNDNNIQDNVVTKKQKNINNNDVDKLKQSSNTQAQSKQSSNKGQPKQLEKQSIKQHQPQQISESELSDNNDSDSCDDDDDDIVDSDSDNGSEPNNDSQDSDIEIHDNNNSTSNNTQTSTIDIQPFNTGSTSSNTEQRQPTNISQSAQNIINQHNKLTDNCKLIIVLLNASLETIKTKKGYELVEQDTHHKYIKHSSDNKDNIREYRPDILHQCLLTLLDSPLNKQGRLTIYIQTVNNVLIQVNSKIRIPRTYKRFAGLMVQLLHKFKIRSKDSNDILLKVIKNNIQSYLPVGSIKLGTSVTGELIDLRSLTNALPVDRSIVITIGAQAQGQAKAEWTQRDIAVSQYPLSAAYCIARILNAFEYQWGCL